MKDKITMVIMTILGLGLFVWSMMGLAVKEVPYYRFVVFFIYAIVYIDIMRHYNGLKKKDELEAMEQEEIQRAVLLSVSGHKPTYDDMTTARAIKRPFKFHIVTVNNHEYDKMVYSDDPALDSILEKTKNMREIMKDKHITKTRIIAVNNETVTSNSGSVIGRAAIGMMVAGEVGAVVGAMSAGGKKTTASGENTYTFVLMFDDRPPETEKVKETDKRFQFLISKLEA